jgi:hypothetical protein
VADGLKVEPDHGQLLELQHELGLRKRPVLSFLSRSNPINSLLGRIRHLVKPQRAPRG